MNSAFPVSARGASDTGLVRQTNQDAFLVDTEHDLYIVADGMGGHAGGEIASSMCIHELSSHLGDRLPEVAIDGKHPSQSLLQLMAQAVNQASTRIYERSLEEHALRGMGTTATVLQICDHFGYCAHVGDSRLYLVRCGFIYQMTKDHSLVSEQVEAGLLSEEEAKSHQLRNVITRSVGYQEEEDVDTLAFPLMPGDLILLCSDGLYSRVSNREISQSSQRGQIEAVFDLIAMANQRGGDDNITVIIVKIQEKPLASNAGKG